MAFYQISLSVQDGQNKRTSTRVYALTPDGATAANIQTGLGPFLTAFNNVTGGKILRAEAAQILDLGGLSLNTPGAGIYAEMGVGMSFPAGGVEEPFDFIIPARAVATVSSNRVVNTEGGLVDLLSDILGATFTTVGAGDATFTDRNGNDLTLEPFYFPTDRRVGRRVRGSARTRGV